MLDKVQKNIAVVIPCLNEEENLKELLPRLKDKFRVIVVDNKSSDKSKEISHLEKVEVIDCETRGYGNVLLTAIKYLKSKEANTPDILVVFDADCSSYVEDIERVVEPIMSNGKDLVIGQRTQRESGSMPVHAVFGNWLTITLIDLLTGFKYLDMGSLRALRFSSLLELKMEDKTWGWNVEMQIKAVLRGLSILEIPTVYHPRKHGKSKISGSFIGSIRAGWKILFTIFYYYLLEFKPQRKKADLFSGTK